MEEIKIPNEKELKHHTRRLSIKEGIFWSIRNSFGDIYFAPFAILLGFSNSFVAILNSIWHLGPIGQIKGSNLLKKYDRKKIIVNSRKIESLGWILAIFTGIFYLNGSPSFIPSLLLILSLITIVFFDGISYPSWFSLMGDVVDTGYREKWWGKRNTIIYFSIGIFSIASSLFLSSLNEINSKILCLTFFFFLAFLARRTSLKQIEGFYDIIKKKKQDKLSFKKFAKDLTKTNFGKYTLYRTIFSIAMGLTTPLISIYLLRELNLNYIQYIILTLSGTALSSLTISFWGKIADKYGNYQVLKLTSYIIPLTPILWIISSNFIYLLIIPSIIGGTAWNAFIMSSTNFVYDNVKKENRAKSIAYFNLLVGLGTFFGGILGSILIFVIKINWIKPIIFIFILGSILRILIVSFGLFKIKEIRKKRAKEEIKNTFLRGILPSILTGFKEIQTIPKYLEEK